MTEAIQIIDLARARALIAAWPAEVAHMADELLAQLDADLQNLRHPDLKPMLDGLPDGPEFQALADRLRTYLQEGSAVLQELPMLQVGYLVGDLVADSFAMPRGLDILLVDGDIQVRTVFDDTGDSDSSAMLVRGDLSGDVLLNTGHLVVGGTVNARVVYANSGNDAGLWVGAELRADELLLENGQFIECLGAVHAPLTVSVHNRIAAAGGVHGAFFEHTAASAYRARFLPAFHVWRDSVEWDGHSWRVVGSEPDVDFEAVREALVRQHPILSPL